MAKKAPRPEPTITQDLHPRADQLPALRPAHAGRLRQPPHHRHPGRPHPAQPHHPPLPQPRLRGPPAARTGPRPRAGSPCPHHEFGLDVIALVGRLRYAEHRSVPEIRAHLIGRGVAVSERTVTNLLDRYDELLAVALTDDRRLGRLLAEAGPRSSWPSTGCSPTSGTRCCGSSATACPARSCWPRACCPPASRTWPTCWREVRDALPVPIAGVVSDGQHSIRKAVAEVAPGVPHQLCQFHYLREAARPDLTRPTATPRSSSRRRSGGSARSSGPSRAGPTRRRR